MSEHGDTSPEEKIAGIIRAPIEDMGYEVVQIRLLGHENPTLQVMVDRKDGANVNVDDCGKLSRAIGALLDVEDPISGKWMLEVSSPGIDRPLTRLKDWTNYAGHMAKVELHTGHEGRKRFTGTVLGAKDDGQVGLRTMEGEELFWNLADLRKAKLLLTDMLLKSADDGASKA